MLKDCSHDALAGTEICKRCKKPDDWQQHAACLDANPEIFFSENDDYKTINQAKSFCHRCPIKGFCLEEGWNEKYGVWGGFSVDERIHLRKIFSLPKKQVEQREMIRIIAHRF